MLELLVGLTIVGVMVFLMFLWEWLKEKDLAIWVVLGLAILVMSYTMGSIVLDLI